MLLCLGCHIQRTSSTHEALCTCCLRGAPVLQPAHPSAGVVATNYTAINALWLLQMQRSWWVHCAAPRSATLVSHVSSRCVCRYVQRPQVRLTNIALIVFYIDLRSLSSYTPPELGAVH
jgi:hypothetical protein